MASGYATPLYLLAFDRRSSFERGVFGATRPLSPEVGDGIVRAKQLVFEADAYDATTGGQTEAAP